MRRVILLLVALSFAWTVPVSNVHAQPATIALRGAGAVAVESFPGTDLDAAFGFGGTLALRLMPHLDLYGGWDWIRFPVDRAFAGPNHDFEETGYTFGLAFEHPFVDHFRASYRLETGGTYKHVEIENANGDLVSDSGHELGYEFGAGVVLALTDSWRISPMLRYRSLSPEFNVANIITKGNVRYAGIELGLSYRFPGSSPTVAAAR